MKIWQIKFGLGMQSSKENRTRCWKAMDNISKKVDCEERMKYENADITSGWERI